MTSEGRRCYPDKDTAPEACVACSERDLCVIALIRFHNTTERHSCRSNVRRGDGATQTAELEDPDEETEGIDEWNDEGAGGQGAGWF